MVGSREEHDAPRAGHNGQDRPCRASTPPSQPSGPNSRSIGDMLSWKNLTGGYRTYPRNKSSSRRVRHKSKTPIDEHASAVSSEPDALNKDTVNEKPSSLLGKSELGRFARESQMPIWLVELLQKHGQVINAGAMSHLRQLLLQNPTTQSAYICHHSVQHISKLRREGLNMRNQYFKYLVLMSRLGGFCGYRNIQMIISYITGAKSTGAAEFDSDFPSIFQIQDLIESAWDQGFNARGRIETGGIQGTRKYIGTPEAQALLCSLRIPCIVKSFKNKGDTRANALLLQAILAYFEDKVESERRGSKVVVTELPPIYFQHAGHSMTIVGVEQETNGQTNLLVFDPGYQRTEKRAMGLFRANPRAADREMKRYRRGTSYLRRYEEFEILCLAESQMPPIP